MAELTKEQKRINRKLILDALKEETGSSGGDVAAARVDAYRADPKAATTIDYSYVGSLKLSRFYIDPTKPNVNERLSLWTKLKQKFNKPTALDPGGWNSDAAVMNLQAIIEEI